MTAMRNQKPRHIHDAPGIVYDPVTRHARIAGTGLEVWEVINGYRSVGYEWERLERAFNWLSTAQLRAAVTFANLNSDFVAVEIAENDATEDQFLSRTPTASSLPPRYEIPPG